MDECDDVVRTSRSLRDDDAHDARDDRSFPASRFPRAPPPPRRLARRSPRVVAPSRDVDARPRGRAVGAERLRQPRESDADRRVARARARRPDQVRDAEPSGHGVAGVQSRAPVREDPGVQGGGRHRHLRVRGHHAVRRPPPALLIVGTGKTLEPLPRETLDAFRNCDTALEVLDTPNAIATFNILVQEGRSVAAAMIHPGYSQQ